MFIKLWYIIIIVINNYIVGKILEIFRKIITGNFPEKNDNFMRKISRPTSLTINYRNSNIIKRWVGVCNVPDVLVESSPSSLSRMDHIPGLLYASRTPRAGWVMSSVKYVQASIACISGNHPGCNTNGCEQQLTRKKLLFSSANHRYQTGSRFNIRRPELERLQQIPALPKLFLKVWPSAEVWRQTKTPARTSISNCYAFGPTLLTPGLFAHLSPSNLAPSNTRLLLLFSEFSWINIVNLKLFLLFTASCWVSIKTILYSY